MSDVTPNYSLEIQGLMLEASQLELNVQSQYFRIATSQDECRRISENIESTKIAIQSLNEKITNLKGV